MLCECVVGLHLLSLHAPGHWIDPRGREVRYRTATPGAYVKRADGWTAGVYGNSYGDPSAYLGMTFETQDRRWALLVAGVAGYRRAAVLPMVVPSARIDLAHRVSLRIAATPKPPGDGGAAMVHVAIERQY